MKKEIADIRKDYRLLSLNESDVAVSPNEQFGKWWDEAIHSAVDEVNAMTLATVDKAGKPHARIVLVKEFDENGFTFFTNYDSNKGEELAANPYAALVFFWKELERQVRICGSVEKIEAAKSDAYFASRPAGSRIGAWSSPQSKVIADRTVLENNEAKFKEEFGENIPRPQHWGGYIVKPTELEFWQGRSSRLHDRIRYTLQNDVWKIERLAP
jgi:pyridoxamine 5'-phosphate oxidase